MILFPPSKINLGLHVLDKRADGYHNLDTLMYQIPLCDVLEIIVSEKLSFQSSGLNIDVNSQENLCIKAFELLKNKFNIPPVSIHLHKIIPMGAGLGGGSSNASYTLIALNELYNLNLKPTDLEAFALELGSDCPLFINKSPQIARGRGEILKEIPFSLSGYFLKLINTGIHVSTKDAFSEIQFNKSINSIENIVSKPIHEWKNELTNDFESSVFSKYPVLQELKLKLYQEGAIYASMTGSGSTLFGIYENKPSPRFAKEFTFEKILTLE
jgi:4-diphosphocytidyl-2-C-methyl-D-erythritol kinase